MPPDGRAVRARRPADRLRLDAGGAVGRASRSGRVRPSGDRRQAGAARARPHARGRRAGGAGGPGGRAGRHRAGARRLAPGPGGAAAGGRPRLPDDRLPGGLLPARRRRRAPGADRDALPRAVGAGARVLRPPRAARGARGAAAARRRRVELPLSVPRRAGARSGVGRRGCPGVRGHEGGRERGAARADAERGGGDARPRRRASCGGGSTRAGGCWRWATAGRRRTRWTWSPTSAAARRRCGRST